MVVVAVPEDEHPVPVHPQRPSESALQAGHL